MKKNIVKFNQFINESTVVDKEMENLIISVLDSSYEKILQSTPTTKKVSKKVDVSDILPINLLDFMKNNKIPDDAEFGSSPNAYDGFEGDTLLVFDVEVPTNEGDNIFYYESHFASRANRAIREALLANGYHKPVNIYAKNISNKEIYKMYIDKNFDALVNYFSYGYIKK